MPGSVGGGAPAAAAVEAPKEPEKTEFDVKLTGFEAAAKIKVIKEVRAVTSLGLKAAKELVRAPSCPCLVWTCAAYTTMGLGTRTDSLRLLPTLGVHRGAWVVLLILHIFGTCRLCACTVLQGGPDTHAIPGTCRGGQASACALSRSEVCECCVCHRWRRRRRW